MLAATSGGDGVADLVVDVELLDGLRTRASSAVTSFGGERSLAVHAGAAFGADRVTAAFTECAKVHERMIGVLVDDAKALAAHVRTTATSMVAADASLAGAVR
jgi:hypothetical protein